MNFFSNDFYHDGRSRYNVDKSSMTHGDWMCQNTYLNKKPFSFDRYPFQKAIADDEHPNLDCIKPSQIGLALDIETPILTNNGWSTMGALKVGDVVYDEQGKPCNVTYISPIYQDHECYELTFDTGETIVADAKHRWLFSGKVINSEDVAKVFPRQPQVIEVSEGLSSFSSHWLTTPHANEIKLTKIISTPTRPTRCITVDSPSHLYLAGEGLIPTHNTEIQIRKTLAWAKRVPNISIIYTMPNTNMFKRISKARILPIVEGDKAFRGDGGSMDLLKIGTSYVYVTGAAESDATSINADIVMNDEIDLTDSAMLALFNSRLQGSDLRVNQRFSTPTYEGAGVHSGFLISDQRRYLIKCPCCNHWQEPVFDRRFVTIPNLPDADSIPNLIDIDQKTYDTYKLGEYLSRAYIHCEKCLKPLNVGDHANREWVPKYPSRTNARGYKIVTFSTERLDVAYCIDRLLKYKARDNMKGFYNTVLGLPYTDDNVQLSEGLLRHAFTPLANWITTPQSGYFSVGIDVGKTCYITVGTPNGKFLDLVHFETVPVENLTSRLQKLDELFHFRCGGIDWTPEWKLACEVRDWSRGRIQPIQYSDGKAVMEVKDMTGAITHLSCNRTHLLDTIALGIRSGVSQFSGYGNDVMKQTIIGHFRDMVREEQTKTEGQPRWVKLNGNDHFFHAAAYAASGLIYTDALNQLQGPPRSPILTVLQTPQIITQPPATAQLTGLIGFGSVGTQPRSHRSIFGSK